MLPSEGLRDSFFAASGDGSVGGWMVVEVEEEEWGVDGTGVAVGRVEGGGGEEEEGGFSLG